jgi:hypothetical protein
MHKEPHRQGVVRIGFRVSGQVQDSGSQRLRVAGFEFGCIGLRQDAGEPYRLHPAEDRRCYNASLRLIATKSRLLALKTLRANRQEH